MVNLYSIEQLALDRQKEMRRQSIRDPLVRQAADARLGPADAAAAGSAVRLRVGALLVQVGLRLGGAALPQQRAATRRCVCVPARS